MRFILLPLLVLLMVGCSASSALKGLVGGKGVGVTANVQSGAANVQSVGRSTVSAQKIIRPQARQIVQRSEQAEAKIETVSQAEKVVLQEGWSAWATIAGILLAFLTPSPVGPVFRTLSRRFGLLPKNYP